MNYENFALIFGLIMRDFISRSSADDIKSSEIVASWYHKQSSQVSSHQ